MAQQSAKFLQKMIKKVQKGETLNGVFDYLNTINTILQTRCAATTAEAFTSIDQVDEALRVLSSFCIIKTVKQMANTKASKLEITNEILGLDIVKMATLHIKYVNFRLFKDALVKISDVKLRGHLMNLATLMGIQYVQQYISFGYESGYLKKGAQALISEANKLLLTRLRPQVIPLVELFGITDSTLPSAVGNSYGDIYETHLEWAKTSRLNDNKGSIPDGYMEYIMPILQGKL